MNFFLLLIPIISIIFDFLSLVSMTKLNKYKNQRVNNLLPLQTLTASSPYYCLGMFSKYCTSTLMTAGVNACEIIKSTDRYICNYYNSSFTTSLLINYSASNVYVKQKGSFVFLLKYSAN